MITIKILEETETKEDIIYLLEEIMGQIKKGNTSGVYPSWELVEEENN